MSGAEQQVLRTQLTTEAATAGVDVAVQPAGLHRRAKRLVVMDVDSTLIQGEVIEMLAVHAGCEPEVAEITRAAMRGEIDFAESLRRRVRLLAGLDAVRSRSGRRRRGAHPGCPDPHPHPEATGLPVRHRQRRLRRRHRPARAELELDFSLANTLEVRRRTSHRRGRRADRRPCGQGARAARLRRAAPGVPLAQTVAIGDGANDLDMLETAGLGIAFNAKPMVREAADTAVNVPYLDTHPVPARHQPRRRSSRRRRLSPRSHPRGDHDDDRPGAPCPGPTCPQADAELASTAKVEVFSDRRHTGQRRDAAPRGPGL